MRRTIAVCLVLAAAASCSKSPSTPAAPPLSTKAVAPVKESGANGSTADASTAKGATGIEPTAIESTGEEPAAELQSKAQVAGRPPTEKDAERVNRLVVGDDAPDFRLQDQTGTERTLTDLVAEGKVALVFYRSADW